MPVPTEIADGPYLLVGDYDITVGPAGAVARPGKQDRSFHAYLELYFQGKHDGEVRSYCDRQTPKIARRDKDGTQVDYARGETMETFYRARGDTASRRVARLLTERWAAAPAGNHGTFVRDAKNIMSVQGEKQPDGHHYDMSFWYSGGDVYVAFHCYPPRRR
jgi:hypothetical protein